MNTESNVVGKTFWKRWVLQSAIGYLLGFWGGFIAGHFLLSNVMIGIAIGAVVGLMQCRVLRDYTKVSSSWWVLSNVIGMGIGFGLYNVVWYVWEYPFDLSWPLGIPGWSAAFFFGGGIAGFLQQRMLRRHFCGSGWWAAICALGWGLSGFAIQLQIVSGAVLGAITAGMMLSILRQPVKNIESEIK